ncbi:MAG: flavodoxin [Clostridium baratii]|uniref:Flavodoxin n=1 Tax=Clostridium baratii str. Sullivan TaxID=1415775 RepID=A0A0A7FY99_9CLOT|nr:flavodoxin [Clostridium baratii]AIY84592.1 flavodoxin [Clostridium baratii str. Sullivan]MBS6005837.1 flavodoxin [Clostridium baratii]MDU4912350.1 flavodoxin [Clostridium baratii]CUP21189.1 flavodoxin [Clostridium baratii]
MKINIIYYSSTGNTEEMANLIAKGAKEEGAEVNLMTFGEASVDDVKNCDVVLLGGPAMGAENLEESEVEPFVESIEGEVSGKKMILFGSFGWGGGAYMTEWENRMEENGAELLEKEVVVQEAPEGEDAEKLIELGKRIAK